MLKIPNVTNVVMTPGQPKTISIKVNGEGILAFTSNCACTAPSGAQEIDGDAEFSFTFKAISGGKFTRTSKYTLTHASGVLVEEGKTEFNLTTNV